ncbi:hypothetical protein fugu_005451 [Takifugu bimaculatus]|uniref:RRM domain-containing protein n=1 Tax=Takifugu bimaculatus TaxID=433685 RepID=A0A4Z2BCQ1_9TELE|nr:hypothetical protein fugu_005451 [Takifugu bimaculatus]
MQRLYVGGLSHTVTQKDLKDRFGKFGDVEDVELRIRRDTEGVPYKTFGYININISDANLKRYWLKSDRLQQNWILNVHLLKTRGQKMLELPERSRRGELHHESCSARNRSTRARGIIHYKNCSLWNAPGSVNWVVSKFGRVLPILQLSQQKGIKVRPMKYDPSKYSHNIRRLDQSGLEPATPVTGLTWELQGGDSDISRKRRGEFPPFQAPKRSCTDDVKVNDRGRAKTRPNPPTADVADPVEDEDDFEVVGLDHVVKSARSCLLENDDEDEESSSSSSDSDYEAMFSNVPLMKISLADLQKLTEESQRPSEAAAPGSLSPPSEEESPLQVERRVPKKGTTPEQILASILEDFRRDELKEKRMTKKTCTEMTLPPFRGTRALREEEGGREEGNKIQKLDSDAPQLDQRTMGETVGVQRNGETEKNAESSEEDEEDDASGALKPLPDKNEDNIVLAQEPDKDAEKVAPPAHHSKASSSEEEEDEEEEHEEEDEDDEDDSEEEEDNEEEEDDEEDDSEEEGEERDGEGNRAPVQMFKEDEEQQRKDNMRRLAAIQQRQKVTEEHKKVIQSALAKLDSSAPGAGKHIIFDSDEEDHGKNSAASKKTLLEDSQSEDETPATGHNNLFEGMEDEDSDDDTRFNIRPQFEGEAGHKLMELQSRFRTDERFRMDSRFLEDDEDKEEEKEKNGATTAGDETLEEEKKKNLSILQSVLGSSQQSCTSTAGKAKTFRDVSALHYDPTREEHATLETRTTANKDSKSARRKKREEAEKLPEVSKEIYYDVSCDLKAVFGQKKDGTPEEEEKMNWDQKVEAEEEKLPESLHPADPSVAPEESTGFQFSFFGDDAETGGPLRGEEEEEEEVPKDDGEQISTVEQSKEKTAAAQGEMFFFVQDDSRLTEGPRMFCCSSHLEEQKEQWEERRSALRMEYRKKHKEAKRKLRLSKKS